MATIRPLPESGSAIAASGWVTIADISVDGGTVTSKVFQNPGDDTVLQSCVVSGTDLNITIRSSYPKVLVNATNATLSPAADTGHYEGVVPVTIPGTGTISVSCYTANDVLGCEDYASVTLVPPPNLLTLSFTGGYPGSQTELKEDDQYDIQLTTDKDFDQVEVLDYEAGKSKLIAVAATSSWSGSIDIADRGTSAVLRPARIRVRDATTGAYSDTRDTDELGGSVEGTDLVKCNNLYPSVTIGAIIYPVDQQALKGSESATVGLLITDFDSVFFNSPTAELSINLPTTYETTKTVTRIAGTYNVSTNNFRAVATRDANNSQTVEEEVVYIANSAAQISVLTPASRLRSGGNDGTSVQEHTITISGDQLLLSAGMEAGVGGGTFIGTWSGSPPDATWTRVLQVHDDDTKGVYSWQNMTAVNLAGIETTIISYGGSYELGGFVARDLTFGPFQTETDMNVEVSDFSKLTAGIFTATNQPALKQSIGTPPPVTDGYTIDAVSVNPTSVIWLDTYAAGGNSTGTAKITDVEETV